MVSSVFDFLEWTSGDMNLWAHFLDGAMSVCLACYFNVEDRPKVTKSHCHSTKSTVWRSVTLWTSCKKDIFVVRVTLNFHTVVCELWRWFFTFIEQVAPCACDCPQIYLDLPKYMTRFCDVFFGQNGVFFKREETRYVSTLHCMWYERLAHMRISTGW